MSGSFDFGSFGWGALNFIAGNIPENIKELMVPDVDPNKLAKAAQSAASIADQLTSLEQSLMDAASELSEGWSGPAYGAFAVEFWQPLDAALLQLRDQYSEAAGQLMSLATQAAVVMLQKDEYLLQQIEMALDVDVISFGIGGKLAGLVAETVERVVGDMVDPLLALLLRNLVEMKFLLNFRLVPFHSAAEAMSANLPNLLNVVRLNIPKPAPLAPSPVG